MIPILPTIAGSDSGVDIQTDLKAFSAFGVYGAPARRAPTARNTHAVAAFPEYRRRTVAAATPPAGSDYRPVYYVYEFRDA
ncbi:MAG: bifunctional hydroxymethylpyrimidine kinase/phosphomethylpyrimidine kinase [Spirochaetales bacterium]|nr:bifunctional hydroxymethylpyrimidine kinase/phosphomethylpyrimidine kinase [Spirochaetales bacterium]